MKSYDDAFEANVSIIDIDHAKIFFKVFIGGTSLFTRLQDSVTEAYIDSSILLAMVSVYLTTFMVAK